MRKRIYKIESSNRKQKLEYRRTRTTKKKGGGRKKMK
jgi:hypothetical protein